jgi:hypothetical protein
MDEHDGGDTEAAAGDWKERRTKMAIMCKLGKSCTTHRGLCGHEKAMLGMMILAVAGALIYWLV